MKLYEIAERYKNLEELLGNPDIEENMIVEALDKVDGEFEEKAENIGKFIKLLDANSKAIDEEIKRLTKLKKSNDNQKNWLKNYLYNAMKLLDKLKLKTKFFNFWIQKNPISLKITDETKLPDTYKETEVITTINKEALKEDLKNGLVIEGAELTQGEGLRIR
ncbi:MAG: siphovirus Gp157 family protein [Clostridium sp.]